jgi:hypothetical protein
MNGSLLLGLKILLLYAWIRLLGAGFRWLMERSSR